MDEDVGDRRYGITDLAREGGWSLGIQREIRRPRVDGVRAPATADQKDKANDGFQPGRQRSTRPIAGAGWRLPSGLR